MAVGTDTDVSDATAGSGGVVAGNAATSNTADNSTVTATIAQGNELAAGNIGVDAAHTDQYAATANSSSAGAASASGAFAENDASSTVLTQIDAGNKFYATGNILITAENHFMDNNPDAAVTGGSGGVLAGAAAASKTVLTGNADVLVADGVTLDAGLDQAVAEALLTQYDGYSYTSGNDPFARVGNVIITASSILHADDTVTMDVGGVLGGSGTASSLSATLNNKVQLGDSDKLVASGNVGLGTFTQGEVTENAEDHTYGGGAVGDANASTIVGTDQTVNLAGNDELLAFGAINVTAGFDPAGNIPTLLSIDSLAASYVRGIIAIPAASATTQGTSNAHVNVGNGSQLLGGGDVTLGAYESQPAVNADGTGQGFEAGFVPVTNHDSHATSAHSGDVALDGSVTAGIYADDEVNIGANGRLTHDHGAPLYYYQQNDFQPQDYIQAHSSGFDANNPQGGNTDPTSTESGPLQPPTGVSPAGTAGEAVSTGGSGDTSSSGSNPTEPSADKLSPLDSLAMTTTQGPTSATTLGSLYAAGGNVTVHADQLSGSGHITAQGGPQINVENASDDYLVLGGIKIPGSDGGQVVFTGAASQSSDTALQLTPTSDSAKPVININNTSDNVVKVPGDPSTLNQGAAIFIGGNVTNDSGQVNITNASGSIGQFALISALQVTEIAPNGAVAIYKPNSVLNAGSDPLGVFASWQIDLGNANKAVDYVANAMFGGSYNNMLTRRALNDNNILFWDKDPDGSGTTYTPSGSAYVFLGQCASAVSGADCSEGTAKALSPVGGAYSGLPQGYAGDAYFPELEQLALNASNNNAPPSNGGDSGSLISAAIISITGKDINISGELDAGRPTDYQVSVSPYFQDYIDQYLSDQPASSGIVDVPQNYMMDGTRQQLWSVNQASIPGLPAQVQYDVANKRVVVNNINASGGGVVVLNGGIVNTTTIGNININDGYGHVTVDSKSTLPVEVRDINTGSNTLGQIKITDTEKTFSVNGKDIAQTHWYIDQQGVGLNVYDNSNGAASVDNAHLDASYNSAPANLEYMPETGLRYQWTQQVKLARDLSTLTTFSPWHYQDANNNATNTPQYKLTGVTITPGNSADAPEFEESITGTASYGVFSGLGNGHNIASVEHVIYHGCDKGTCNYGFPETGYYDTGSGRKMGGAFEYIYPTQAQLNLTSSVKADYPIGISFTGNAQGQVNIASPSTVLIAGKIYNPSGPTEIDAGGAINEGLQGNIISNGLTLNANDGIAAADRPLLGSLTGGLLNVTAGNQGVYQKFASSVNVGHISIGNAAQGYGDLVLQAAQSITAGDAGDNITADNIALVSTSGGIGTDSMPLTLSAHPAINANGSPDGGVVNLTGLQDINLVEDYGNLRIGLIQSTAGNVSLAATRGSMVDASGTTSGQALSQAQLTKVRQDLHLTSDENGAQIAESNSKTPFENTVDAKYNQYWQLLQNGSVSNSGEYQLGASKVALYKPLVSAALGLNEATTAQVQSYVNDQYHSLLTFFQNNIDSNATTQPNFNTYDPDFAYQATSSQIDSLTNGAVYTPGQLVQAINKQALDSAGNTPVGTATPNVVGRSVTLTTQASIGALGQTTAIDATDLKNGTLSDDKAAALAAASAPGDVTLIRDANGDVTEIDVQQTEPLFLTTSGTVNATAPSGNGSIFLQDNSGLTLASIAAGKDVRLISVDSIINGLPDLTQPVITAGGDLTLLAGSAGSIGTPAQSAGSPPVEAAPLTYSIDGTLQAADAGQDVVLKAIGHDLVLGRVGAGNNIFLDAPDGGIYGFLDGLSVNGQNIELTARDGVGFRNDDSKYLQVQLGSDGELDGTAGGSARLESPDSAHSLQVGHFAADGDTLDIVSQGDLTAGTLNANHGTLNASSGGKAMLDTLYSADESTLTAVGDLLLTSATSDLANGLAVDVQAGGSILANGLGNNAANITATGVGAGINLAAGTSIGDPLTVDTANMTAQSDSGDINIIDLRGLESSDFNAHTGSDNVVIHGDFNFTHLLAGQNVTGEADGAINGATLTASEGSARLTSGDNMDLTTASTGTRLNLNAGGAMTLGTADSGADQILTSVKDLTFN
ncbi:hypothetical protein [Salinisphaera sp. LB1]|uniref:beta strand repeat-containing protein n=1 Tax=Salinisphaera sp. LB1 TaxID=2183911 RepID=UPI000D708D55|nr:hypothetical protein [Salinisphaera sp. LB1]